MDEADVDDGRLEPPADVGRAIPEIEPFARAGSRESGATNYQNCVYAGWVGLSHVYPSLVVFLLVLSP